MAGLRIHVVMPAELVERIDAALVDGQSRGGFVRRAVEQALSEAKEPTRREQAGPGSVPSSEGVRPAAPAEQPRGRNYARRAVDVRAHAATCKCQTCVPPKT